MDFGHGAALSNQHSARNLLRAEGLEHRGHWLEFAERMPVGFLLLTVTQALDQEWNYLPGNSTVQRRLRNEIEGGNSEVEEAQNCQDGVDGLEAGVAENCDPDSERDSDCGLSNNSSPGDYAVVKLGPWSVKDRLAMDGI